jgi:hypothetical protein
MKKFILLVLLFLIFFFWLSSLAAKAQNSNMQNDVISVTLTGHTGTRYLVTIENKMPCNLDVVFEWNKASDTTITLAPGVTTITLPGPYMLGTDLRAHSNTKCNKVGDNSILKMPVPQLTPLALPDMQPRKRTPQNRILPQNFMVYNLDGVLLFRFYGTWQNLASALHRYPSGWYVAKGDTNTMWISNN